MMTKNGQNDSKSERLCAVVIPSHNRPEALNRALNSVFGQTVLPRMVVVVDDGSTTPLTQDIFDAAPDVLSCCLVRNEIPLGSNGARNYGLEWVDSELVCFLDDDDMMLPHRIERLESSYLSNPSDLITTKARVVLPELGVSYVINPPDAVSFSEQLIRNSVGTTSMVAVRRERFAEAGGFDVDMPARQDYEAWLRLLAEGAMVSKVEEVCVELHVSLGEPSVSKSITNNWKAISFLNRKYANSIADLSSPQRRARSAANVAFMIHKNILNRARITAFRVGILGAIKLQSSRLAVAGVLALIGPKAFFWALGRRRT